MEYEDQGHKLFIEVIEQYACKSTENSGHNIFIIEYLLYIVQIKIEMYYMKCVDLLESFQVRRLGNFYITRNLFYLMFLPYEVGIGIINIVVEDFFLFLHE